MFSRENLKLHKTFHRYVVRAKRGTAQGTRDSQGNAPKSAGASIRRHNEAALREVPKGTPNNELYQQNILYMELYIHMYDSGYNQGILKTI